MSQNRLPKIQDPLKSITDLSIKPVETMAQETNRPIDDDEDILEPQEEVDSSDVFSKYKKKERVTLETKDIMENNTDLDIEPPSGRGKRGKDKAKRKKKTLSASQLAGLKAGRLKSLETRRKNKKAKEQKIQEPKMPPPIKNEKLDYDTFSNYMDLYEEKRKTKQASKVQAKQPHPNKLINPRHRPIAPQSLPRKPRVAKWTGNISTFASHTKTKGNGRWNYGI
jgi:hypothetical protein|tara:strand:- start:2625 stop:3296 length:672 start_codon:yes stop_codon:yes gene_type:complete